MSPEKTYEDFYSEHEDERIISDIRSSFAFVFSQVVQIYKLIHQSEKASIKFDEVAELTEKLHQDNDLNDYLYKNLKAAYNQYSTMVIGKLKEEERLVGRETQLIRLKKLREFLSLLIGDLSEEINSSIQENMDVEK